MKEKTNLGQNNEWENLKYRIICDRWGNYHTTISFTASNKFHIDPHINYHYLSEEEVEDIRRKEEEAAEARRKQNKVLITIILDLVEEHFTPTQKYVITGYLQGKTWTEMAQKNNCSESAIRQVFWGNSVGQGGIIRKLQKLLPDYQNYFDSC